MKRYLLFNGDIYFPGQGFDDFVGDTDDEESLTNRAESIVQGNEYQYAQIVDTKSLQKRVLKYADRVEDEKPTWSDWEALL